jgi:prepilin-type N-terminal cleavage/methylation domain-containing protein
MRNVRSRIRRHQHGFTLVELLIVVGIVAVISAISVPLVVQFAGKGVSESYDADRHSLQTLVNAYQIEFGCLPTADGDGGDVGSSYIVFAGYIGNVDGNGHARQASSTLAANVTAGQVHISVADVNAADNVFMVGHSITIAADNSGNPAEEATVAAIDTSTNVLTLKDELEQDHSIVGGAPEVSTNEQGLIDSEHLLTEPPSSSAAVLDGSTNMNGGVDGSYTWYCNQYGSVLSDPEKMEDVYP